MAETPVPEATIVQQRTIERAKAAWDEWLRKSPIPHGSTDFGWRDAAVFRQGYYMATKESEAVNANLLTACKAALEIPGEVYALVKGKPTIETCDMHLKTLRQIKAAIAKAEGGQDG